MHICFGYGMVVKGVLAKAIVSGGAGETPAQMISVETAQSKLDARRSCRFGKQAVMLGVLDLSTSEVESAEPWPPASVAPCPTWT